MARNESQGNQSSLLLDARPASITLDTTKTAVLVVDMQNDYGTKGGLFDRAGIDISLIRNVVAPTATVLASARSIGIPIVYIKAGIRADLSDLGAPGTPQGDRWRAYGVGQRVEAPDGREGRILIRDTWNTDIIPELEPEPGDPIVYKHGYSPFHDTGLDAVLQQLGIKHLIVTGGTTSVCVESTIRDAYSRHYSCILLEDCTAEPIGQGAKGYHGMQGVAMNTGGGSNYDATLLLVQTTFGWVSDSPAVIRTINAHRQAALPTTVAKDASEVAVPDR
jgi:ureidoacrylate peracid hydrolase